MENVEEVKEAPLTEQDDELFQSVSDEYLNKKKRNRIISLSIISAVIFALAVVIITLACVRLDLKPYFLEEGSKYSVIINDSEVATFISNSENEEYDEFYKHFQSSFYTSYLTAIFTGKLGSYTIERTNDTFYSSWNSSTETGTGMSTTLDSALGSNYVHISYGVEQTLFNADGTPCKSQFNSSVDLKYVDVYFPISSENTDGDLTFYFGSYGYSQPRIAKITIRANTYAIYDYVVNL